MFWCFRILVVVTVEDVSFAPFVLNFIRCVQDVLPKSSVPSGLLSSLVMAFTQHDSTAMLSTFHFVLDIFLTAVTQDLSICQPKVKLCTKTNEWNPHDWVLHTLWCGWLYSGYFVLVHQCCLVNYSQPLTMWQITVNYECGVMVSRMHIFVCCLGVVTCISLQAWHVESNCSWVELCLGVMLGYY